MRDRTPKFTSTPLLVAYLLERRGLGVDVLLNTRLDRIEVERQLETEPDLATPAR